MEEQAIGIVTDSSCDLPPELLERFKIVVVSQIVHFGAEVYEDVALSVDAFWEKVAEGIHPQTSQPSVGAFREAFARLIAQGKQVLCLTITGKHSGTFNSARLAAEEFGARVRVFDSLSLSLGLGLQALAAAQEAQAGRSLEEIVAVLEDLRSRIRLTILLDTLENLRRGGRADGFIAVVDRMTRAFNIKPIINVVEGQLRLLGAARSFDGGIRRILKLVEELVPLEHLGVIHTRSRELAEDVARWLAERTGFPREKMWVRETGAVLSVHAGRGVIGVVAVPEG